MADELYLYLLVRTDMPSMKYGKGVAQGAHAANLFTDREIIKRLVAGKKPNEAAMAWRAEGSGFGTTITLDVDKVKMNAVVEAADALGFAAGISTDPTYPYIVDKEIFPLIREDVHTDKPVFLRDTVVCFRAEQPCAYVFGKKDELAILLRQFNLLSND